MVRVEVGFWLRWVIFGLEWRNRGFVGDGWDCKVVVMYGNLVFEWSLLGCTEGYLEGRDFIKNVEIHHLTAFSSGWIVPKS